MSGRSMRMVDVTAEADTAAMYERYSARVHRFCVRRLDSGDEAADAVQDIFLRAWLALRGGAEIRYPLPWLLTIADNVCVSRFRARDARVRTTELDERGRVEFPEAIGEVARLTAAFGALPVRQRRALLRRELQGFSYDEIGAELGVSRASVAALIHRARLAVADRLGDARRGLAAVFPVPGLLRAAFDGGAASVAAAGTGAVAVAVAQLAAPAAPGAVAVQKQPAVAIAQWVGDGGVARDSAASMAIARARAARPPSGGAGTTATDLADVPSTVEHTESGPGSPDVASPQSAPDRVPSADPPSADPNRDEPATTTDAGPREAEPASAAADLQATANGQGLGHANGHVQGQGNGGVPPGRQPKGETGRSASAPGQTTHQVEPATEAPGSVAPNGGQSQAGGTGNANGHDATAPRGALGEGAVSPLEPDAEAMPPTDAGSPANPPAPDEPKNQGHGPPPGHRNGNN